MDWGVSSFSECLVLLKFLPQFQGAMQWVQLSFSSGLPNIGLEKHRIPSNLTVLLVLWRTPSLMVWTVLNIYTSHLRPLLDQGLLEPLIPVHHQSIHVLHGENLRRLLHSTSRVVLFCHQRPVFRVCQLHHYHFLNLRHLLGKLWKYFLPLILHLVCSKHRWLVDAPLWIHSNPEVWGMWLCWCSCLIWLRELVTLWKIILADISLPVLTN